MKLSYRFNHMDKIKKRNGKLFIISFSLFLLLTFTSLISSQEAQEQIFQELFGVEVIYENNAFSIANIFFDIGYPSESLNASVADFVIRTLDKSNNPLNELYFNLPETPSAADPSWFDPKTGEQIVIPEALEVSFQKVYYLYYVEGVEFVGIYNVSDGSELVKVDISDYIICGDGVCQDDKGENFVSCPRDCEPTKEDLARENFFLESGKNDSYVSDDDENIEEAGEEQPSNFKSLISDYKVYILIGLGIITVIISIIIFIVKKRKEEETPLY